VYRLIEEAAEGEIAEPQPLKPRPAAAAKDDPRQGRPAGQPVPAVGEDPAEFEEDSGDVWYDAPGGWSGYPWAWGWYPWYGVPQTRIVREYPPPITHIPRLGLQYNYPYAYQMGIRIPDDSSPLDHPPTMGPFVGVVQAAKEELRRQEAQARRAASIEDRALALMQGGEYTRAGRVLAKGFESSMDPRYPLRLAEVFFALEKPAVAESLLRHAMRSKAVTRVLPSDIRSHFADSKEFDARLDALAASGRHGLLAAYLFVTSKRVEEGVELLGTMSANTPEDIAANRLYRHYLSKALVE
jgi:hypothetical protein